MRYTLFDNVNNTIEEFATQAECIKYCVTNKICNAGWVKRSIKTGERFYIESSPQKDYKGFGYKVVRSYW